MTKIPKQSRQANKQNKITIATKQNKKKHQTWSLFCSGQLFLGMGPAPKCGVHLSSDTLLEKTDFSFPSKHRLWIAISFFFRGGNVCSLLVLGFLSDLNLGRSCVYCHHLCEFICAAVLLFLEDTVLLASSPPPGSYMFSASFAWVPELWGEEFNKDIPLGLGAPKFLTLCTLSSYESLLKFSSIARSFSDESWWCSVYGYSSMLVSYFIAMFL